MSANNDFVPVDVSDVDISRWSGKKEWPVKLANFYSTYAPRGKAAIPRLIGRLFSDQIHSYELTKHGARLAIAPHSLDMFSFLHRTQGSWTDYVVDVCAGFLQNGGVFYDIGANAGYMSMEIAQLFRGDVTVVSMEPQQDLSRNIALSARLNQFKSVQVLPIMLGETEGTRDLFLVSHSIHASAVSRAKRSKKVPCPLTTLDRLVASGQTPPPNVIKMDVEGSELAVFRGARNTLRDFRPVIVFEYDENAQRFGYTKGEVIEYIRGIAEYDFFDIASDGTLFPVTARPADVLARPKHLQQRSETT